MYNKLNKLLLNSKYRYLTCIIDEHLLMSLPNTLGYTAISNKIFGPNIIALKLNMDHQKIPEFWIEIKNVTVAVVIFY